jgi:hypothetical protein
MKYEIIKVQPTESQVPAALLLQLYGLIEQVDVKDSYLPQEMLKVSAEGYALYARYNHSDIYHNFKAYEIVVINHVMGIHSVLPAYRSKTILALHLSQNAAEQDRIHASRIKELLHRR